MSLHSKILMHWTDAKIPGTKNKIIRDRKPGEPISQYCKIFSDDKIISSYIDHLMSILHKGLEFGTIEEKHWFNDTERKRPVEEVCFTELKLSQSATDEPLNVNDRYGYLGIGVHRQYVIDNFGAPVFYAENKQLSGIIEGAYSLLDNANGNKDTIRSMEKILGHFKMMGEDKKDHYFKNYGDLEWRISLYEDIKEKIDKHSTGCPPNIEEIKEKYYLKFKCKLGKRKGKEHEKEKCIECIVFPHEDILYKSLEQLRAKEFFDEFRYNNMPMLTTVNRIRHL